MKASQRNQNADLRAIVIVCVYMRVRTHTHTHTHTCHVYGCFMVTFLEEWKITPIQGQEHLVCVWRGEGVVNINSED
jgi:hypothetical protein